MLDPKLLRSDLDQVVEKLKIKNFDFDADDFRKLEEERKRLQVSTQNLQGERNSRSRAIGDAKGRGEDIQQQNDDGQDNDRDGDHKHLAGNVPRQPLELEEDQPDEKDEDDDETNGESHGSSRLCLLTTIGRRLFRRCSLSHQRHRPWLDPLQPGDLLLDALRFGQTPRQRARLDSVISMVCSS